MVHPTREPDHEYGPRLRAQHSGDDGSLQEYVDPDQEGFPFRTVWADSHVLAALRDGRIKASADTIAKSLVGDYRREHLFTLAQSLKTFRHYQELIGACDREIERSLQTFESKADPESPLPKSLTDMKRFKGDPRFELRTHLHRVFGVDLTQIPGVKVLSAQTFLAEIGPDLSRFASAPTFTSWLGLCPDTGLARFEALRANCSCPEIRSRPPDLHSPIPAQ